LAGWQRVRGWQAVSESEAGRLSVSQSNELCWTHALPGEERELTRLLKAPIWYPGNGVPMT